MKLRIRCPSCTKLYEVTSDEIHSEMPLFECLSCETKFSFEFPPVDPKNVKCFPVVLNSTTTSVATHQEYKPEIKSQEKKSCPKCGALNNRHAHECYSCHVLFDKLEGLPKDTSLKAQPSLVRKWKNLIENFDNEDLHDEFIRACHELDALRFATLKYEDLKKAQGGDPKCDQMIAQINALSAVGLAQKPLNKYQPAAKPRSKWHKYFYWGPFGFSTLLILLGMVNLGHRNLIGAGVALAFMAAGLIVMVKGKISFSDFID